MRLPSAPKVGGDLRPTRVFTVLRAKGRGTRELHRGMDLSAVVTALTQTHVRCNGQRKSRRWEVCTYRLPEGSMALRAIRGV